MNLYIVVEGEKTEYQLYPKWLSYLVPELSQVYSYKDVIQNNFYIFSGQGIPAIYNHVANAIRDINSFQHYNYLIICLDSDELSVENRKKRLLKHLEHEGVTLNENCQLEIIVQNKCIETWFLGNRKVYKRNPEGKNFKIYSTFYNVELNDPELMPNFRGFFRTAQFHEAYLRVMLKEYNIKYRKSRPKEVLEEKYFNELLKRIEDLPDHLKSFAVFVELCTAIRHKILNSYE